MKRILFTALALIMLVSVPKTAFAASAFRDMTVPEFLTALGVGEGVDCFDQIDPTVQYDPYVSVPADVNIHLSTADGKEHHNVSWIGIRAGVKTDVELTLADMPQGVNFANIDMGIGFNTKRDVSYVIKIENARIETPGKNFQLDGLNGTFESALTHNGVETDNAVRGDISDERLKLPANAAALRNGIFKADITLIESSGVSKAEYYMELGSSTAPLPTAEWFRFLKSQGFSTVYFYITWFNHTNDQTYVIDKEWLDKIEETANLALAEGLYCIISMINDGGNSYTPRFTTGYTEAQIARLPNEGKPWLTLDGDPDVEKRCAEIWRQIAERFKDYDEHVIFEGVSEPKSTFEEGLALGIKYDGVDMYQNGIISDWGEVAKNINRLNQIFVDSIRTTGGNNAKRFLIVSTASNNSNEAALKPYKHPNDPAKRTVTSIHSYSNADIASGRQADFNTIDKYLIDKGIGVIFDEFIYNFNDGAQPNEEVADWIRSSVPQLKQRNIPYIWHGSSLHSANDPNDHDCSLYNPWTFEVIPERQEWIDLLMSANPVSEPSTSAAEQTSAATTRATDKPFNSEAQAFLDNLPDEAKRGFAWARKSLDGIEYIEAYRDDGKKKPLMFVLHGGGGHKEQEIGELDWYAHEGFYAVGIDAAAHGDSQRGAMLNMDAWLETVGYIDTLIDFYASDKNVDAARFAVGGSSMGGAITFLYGVKGEHTPSLLMPEVGAADYTKIFNGRANGIMDQGEQTGEEEITPELTAKANELSAVNNVDKFVDIPMWANFGELDKDGGVEGAIEFIRLLKEAGGTVQHLRIIKGGGHGGFPDRVNDGKMEYIRKYMKIQD